MSRWDDVNARARGLSTHLLSASELRLLSRTAGLAALANELGRRGFPVSAEAIPTPAEVELAVRRWAAAALGTLARWAGRRTPALAVIYEDEDRKSLRAIIRGAARGAATEARLSGLIPTPALPERALEELARQASVAAIATLLQVWHNPYGLALAPLARTAQPDSFAIDLVLDRTFAARALSAARPAGAELLGFVRETVDVANATTAIVLSSAGKDLTPKEAFLPGGDRVSIVAFEEAAAAGGPVAAGGRLARTFAPGPLSSAFRDLAADPDALEDEVLRIRVRALALRVRLAPLGPAPALWFALRLRAQVIDLQRIAWGAALAAPPADIVAALVTAG
ncbi:MAG: V-type ATPase subunit [Acidobacteriota bacterium]